jgi:N utilization substance protein B
MTRTVAREIAVRLCFELSENPQTADALLDTVFERTYYETLAQEDELFSSYPNQKQMDYIRRIIRGIGAHSAELDGYIEKYAVGWKFSRISRTALAIMKTAMYEVLYMPDVPNGVALNEAIELAKKYEEDGVAPFVNGVLGSFIKGEVIE